METEYVPKCNLCGDKGCDFCPRKSLAELIDSNRIFEDLKDTMVNAIEEIEGADDATLSDMSVSLINLVTNTLACLKIVKKELQ